MPRLLLPWVLLSALVGCIDGAPGDDPLPTTDPPVPEFHGDPSETNAVHAGRVVARTVDAGVPCPNPEAQDWTVRPLLPGGRGESTRFCLYERQPGGQSPGPLGDLVPRPGVFDLGRSYGIEAVYDRIVLAPAGTQPDMAGKFYARFRDEAGTPDWVVAPTALPARARLVLIDSSPELGPPPDAPNVLDTAGNGDHGFLLAHLARELACLGGAAERCFVELTAQPALAFGAPPWPGTPDPADPPEAWVGSWGTIGMLAEAIWQSVVDWRSAGRDQPLVLNLSVAWHPFFDGGIPGSLEVLQEGALVDFRGQRDGGRMAWERVVPETWAMDVHAVFGALQEARCEGAVVVAAAGNATAGTVGTRGPMLPAAWGALPLAALPPCPEGTRPPEDVADTPLVWAVGGTDASDRELVVSRPGSRPPLLAFGDHAVSDRGAGTDDKPLTGTSVSALVVSTTAALMLSAEPGLSPRRVMRLMWEKGQPIGAVEGPFLDLPPTVIEGLLPTQVDAARVVRTCEALSGLGPPWRCPTPAAVGDPVPVPVAGTAAGLGDLSKPMDLPACGVGHQARYAAAQTWPESSLLCPERQRLGPQLQPWTYPQPQGSECPFCFVDVAVGQLYLELDRSLSWFDGITVTLVTASDQRLHYTLPSALQTADTSLLLAFNPAALPAGVEKARLTLVKGDTSQLTALTLKTAP